MATLPQAADYGKRVGLRSNRVDIPGQGEMAVANALERAAGTFTKMAVEHKQKDDALSYANAKNEYLIADIQEREKLKLDPDYSTHDERYRTAMKGHYERLFPTVNSARDRTLFDAEARLMNERGSVSVGDNARKLGINQSVDAFNSHAQDAKAIILTSNDAQTAQDAMFGILEEATALRDKGYFTPEQYKQVLQKWVQETSFSRLMAMDPADREKHLEASVTLRKTTGKPITEEMIKQGLGSGSIADFLPLDTAVAMLETTQKANEIEMTLGAAQEIFDLASAENQTDSGAMMDAIRELTKDADPEVREKALVLGRQERQDRVNEKSDDQNRIMLGISAGIENGMSPDSANPDDLALLSPAQKATLDLEYQRHLEDSKFGPATAWTKVQQEDRGLLASYALWNEIPDEQRAYIDLQQAPWRMAFTQEDHTDLVQEQKRIRDRIEGGTSQKAPGGLTNNQMVNSALVRAGFIPQVGREIEDYQAYQQLVFQMDRATADQVLSNTERNAILAEIMKPMAFTDTYLLWADKDRDDMIPIAAMSVEQRETARLAWSKAATDVYTTSSAGIAVNYRDHLQSLATALGADPSQNEYERAYFTLKWGHVHEMTPDEIKQRVREILSGE